MTTIEKIEILNKNITTLHSQLQIMENKYRGMHDRYTIERLKRNAEDITVGKRNIEYLEGFKDAMNLVLSKKEEKEILLQK